MATLLPRKEREKGVAGAAAPCKVRKETQGRGGEKKKGGGGGEGLPSLLREGEYLSYRLLFRRSAGRVGRKGRGKKESGLFFH